MFGSRPFELFMNRAGATVNIASVWRATVDHNELLLSRLVHGRMAWKAGTDRLLGPIRTWKNWGPGKTGELQGQITYNETVIALP